MRSVWGFSTGSFTQAFPGGKSRLWFVHPQVKLFEGICVDKSVSRDQYALKHVHINAVLTHIAQLNLPLTMQYIVDASAEPQTSKTLNGSLKWPTHWPSNEQSKRMGKASSQLKCKRPETNRRTMHGASDKTQCERATTGYAFST
jgi:hypothetical protein